MRAAALVLLSAAAAVLGIPHANHMGYDNFFLATLERSPVCWNVISRCESSMDCAPTASMTNSNHDCNTCYGFIPGRPKSGLCGLAPEKVDFDPTSTAPEQIRVAQGVDPTSMTVSWVTWGTAPSSLEYALAEGGNWVEAKGEVHSYTSYCHGASTPDYTYTSPSIHTVRVSGLQPSATYRYRIGGEGGAQRAFTTAPAVGDMSGPMSFAVLGDLGQTAYSAQTIQHIQADADIAVILHAGDMSYADCDHKRWDSWGLMVDPVASKIPYMVSAGNHEIETDVVQQTTFMAYKNRFAMPEVQPTQDKTTRTELPSGCGPSDYSGHYDFGNSFYSFEFGGVHAIVLNSYTSATVDSPQYLWLQGDLARVDRNKTPFVVAMMHGPWYNTNEAHHDEKMTLNMKGTMEDLFFKYRVNAVFSGHVHAYERTHEVYRNATYAPGGATTYLVLGDAGNREGHADTYLQQANWSAYRNGNHYGHVKVTVYNSSVAVMDWMRNVDPEIVVADSTVLVNDPSVWGVKQDRASA